MVFLVAPETWEAFNEPLRGLAASQRQGSSTSRPSFGFLATPEGGVKSAGSADSETVTAHSGGEIMHPIPGDPNPVGDWDEPLRATTA